MITEEQRIARRAHLGSSDAPAIVGLSPWRTPADVYYSKVYESKDTPTEAMQTGNRLEPAILDFAEERLGVALRRNVHIVSAGRDGGILAANLDALVADRNEAVEAKYCGPYAAAEWGAEGTDEVPDHVNIQVQHQMYVGGLNRVWVAAAIASHHLEWKLYVVPRSDQIISALVAREIEFWERHVLLRCPPESSAPSLDILKALRRDPGSCIDLPKDSSAMSMHRELAAEKRKSAQAEYDDATAKLLAMLGDAEAGLLPDGRMITYLSQRSAPRCDLKRLRAEHPDLYSELVTESTCRVLRIKKGSK